MTIVDINLIYLFRKESEQIGLQKAATKLLIRMGIKKINIQGTIPSKGPVLLISNHPGGLDTMIIQSCTERSDYFPVGLSAHKILGKKISKNLIPIYRKGKLGDELLYFLLGKTIIENHKYSKKEIQKLNRLSITKAADKISQGKIVLMLPQGHSGKSITENNWKAGIGFMVKQISNPAAQIILMKITKSNRYDILRYSKPLIRKKLFQEKEVSIQFSEPISIKKIKNRKKKCGKLITLELEKMYYEYFR